MLTQAQQVNLTSSRFNQDNMNLPSTVTFTQVISDQLRPIKPSRLTAASRLNALAWFLFSKKKKKRKKQTKICNKKS